MKLAVIVSLVLLAGCATVGPSRDWTAAQFDDTTTTLLAQIGLRSEGFGNVLVDGKAGRATRAAALQYRESRGLPRSDEVDGELVEAIFKEHDLVDPMPYIEGHFRSCLRWGPQRVLLMASNAGTITCTVRRSAQAPSPAEIASAKSFCIKQLGVQSSRVGCELLFDGRRMVGKSRLMRMLADPSPDIPVVVEASSSSRGTQRTLPATLRSEPAVFRFSRSATDLRGPQPVGTPIRFLLLAGPRNQQICSGTALWNDPMTLSYSGKCAAQGKSEPFDGEARLVGFTPKGDRLVPAYETRIVQGNSQVKIVPPETVIRFAASR